MWRINNRRFTSVWFLTKNNAFKYTKIWLLFLLYAFYRVRILMNNQNRISYIPITTLYITVTRKSLFILALAILLLTVLAWYITGEKNGRNGGHILIHSSKGSKSWRDKLYWIILL